MNRRRFLQSATAVSAAFVLPDTRRWMEPGVLASDGWRTFELTTRVEVLEATGITRVWVPLPLMIETKYQRPAMSTFEAPGATARIIADKDKGFGMVAAEWPARTASASRPMMTVTSRVQTRDISVDLSTTGPTGSSGHSNRSDMARFLAPSALIPSDGIVLETAQTVTRGARTDVQKAHAIYDWIVDNTFRDPNTKGCGIGDIRYMLESKDLGGKCADLNALYVGLAHAVGLPARDAYGVRVAKSERGYKSLGLSSDNASKAQHCRAEVYLADFGWVPVDPADVRKVVLEESPGQLSLDDARVRRARGELFGGWEMNWIAYNFEHDVKLPGSKGKPIGFFMYPQGETANGRLDSLTPDTFKYSITARELTTD